jgi:histone H3/H4
MTTAPTTSAPSLAGGSAATGAGGAAASAAAGTTTATSKKKTVVKASGAGTKAKKKATTTTTVRKKTATAPKANTTLTNQFYAAARAAQVDLAAQRNDQAARRSDPLWYRAEDASAAVADETVMAEMHARVLPEQVQIVESALAQNGLTRSDVTPQAFACLLEQARRYAMDVLTDSQDYAYVAGRTAIDRADLMLASEMRPDHPISITTQVPKLNLLADRVNRVPLPAIPTQCYSGILLPPKHHQLTARTYDVVTSAQTAQRMVQAAPAPPSTGGSGGTTNPSWGGGGTKASTGGSGSSGNVKATSSAGGKPKPSYGATKGRQIPIHLKGKETTTKEEAGGGGPIPMDR